MTKERDITVTDIVPLLVRIALAVVFMYHGYGKVFAGGHADIAEMMAGKGAPAPELLGWLAGLTEFFGGAFIGLGVLSRLWGLGLATVMAVAIATEHGKNGFDLRDGGYEYCFVLLMMATAILLGGAGAISIDRLIWRPRGQNKDKQKIKEGAPQL